jgi:hypothetical protein
MPSSSRSAIKSRISLSSSSVAMVAPSLVGIVYGLSVVKKAMPAGQFDVRRGAMLPGDRAGV